MAQNVYDQEDFFKAYEQMPRSQQGLTGTPEWPILQRMVGDVRGLSISDLGCGYGWFCRWAYEAGAQSVHGIDL